MGCNTTGPGSARIRLKKEVAKDALSRESKHNKPTSPHMYNQSERQKARGGGAEQWATGVLYNQALIGEQEEEPGLRPSQRIPNHAGKTNTD